MKKSSLNLTRVRNIIRRERIHRNRRKAVNFALLYGGEPKLLKVTNTTSEEINKQFPNFDIHSFAMTRIRTGRIKSVSCVK